MSLLRKLFGPSKEEVWQQLCEEIGADFIRGHWLWGGEKVQAGVSDWIITLDTYTVSTGKSSVTYTRLRAPFVNKDGFRFSIHRAGLFSELGKSLFGMQDIEVGHREFDRDFIIKGNDESKVQALFVNPRIRQLIQGQPQIYLEVKDNEGWFGARFPEGVDELYFQVVGVIKDVERLKLLFDLFAETLNQLCHMDSAYEDDVSLHIEALRSPGGQVKEGRVVLWEGDPARQRAAEGLRRLKDPRAVEPLLSVLDDPDHLLRAKAIRALGGIGDVRAVPSLIPLLGDWRQSERAGRTLSEHAADALRKLGADELVESFLQTLQRDRVALENLKGKHQREVIQGLIKALDSPPVATAVNAAWALGELGAVEALPHLRSKASGFNEAPAWAKEAWTKATAELEKRAALPRPADPAAPDAETLPRPAGEPQHDVETLPRPAHDEVNEQQTEDL